MGLTSNKTFKENMLTAEWGQLRNQTIQCCLRVIYTLFQLIFLESWVKNYTHNLKKRHRRSELNWARFQSSSIINKTMNSQQLKRLYDTIQRNMYLERRRPLMPKFWNKANYQTGRQTITNRAGVLLNDVNFDWAWNIAVTTL